MPVTFDKITYWDARYTDPHKFLGKACGSRAPYDGPVLQSSLQRTTSGDQAQKTVPHSNGFVHAVMEAYGAHRHLRIRPDDVWLAILNQLSFYINAHAEELRPYFVAHEGKKRLLVKTVGDRYSVNYAALVRKFTEQIHGSVVDKTLVEWILPDFTTTTEKDTTVCSVVMMATLKQYFEYYVSITCGIPSVTLEGEKADWERIYHRLWRLYEFGAEPAVWAEMLRPILRRFIAAFDGAPDTRFWGHVAHRAQEYCGQDDLSGWITAFCVWSNEGVWKPYRMPESVPVQPPLPSPPRPGPRAMREMFVAELPRGLGCLSLARVRLMRILPSWIRRPVVVGQGRSGKEKAIEGVGEHKGNLGNESNKEKTAKAQLAEESDTKAKEESSRNDMQKEETGSGTKLQEEPSGSVMKQTGYDYTYTLDGIEYFTLSVGEVPAGYSEVDVIVNDNGEELDCMMIAGHLGYACSSKNPQNPWLDTVSPSPEWFILQKSLRK